MSNPTLEKAMRGGLTSFGLLIACIGCSGKATPQNEIENQAAKQIQRYKELSDETIAQNAALQAEITSLNRQIETLKRSSDQRLNSYYELQNEVKRLRRLRDEPVTFDVAFTNRWQLLVWQRGDDAIQAGASELMVIKTNRMQWRQKLYVPEDTIILDATTTYLTKTHEVQMSFIGDLLVCRLMTRATIEPKEATWTGVFATEIDHNFRVERGEMQELRRTAFDRLSAILKK